MNWPDIAAQVTGVALASLDDMRQRIRQKANSKDVRQIRRL